MSKDTITTPENKNSTVDIVRKIFDAAISMPPGSKIPLTFGSDSQRESFRVRFYNEKKRYSEVVGEIEADTLICAKHTAGSRFMLLIEKVVPMSTPFIITPDGSAIEIDLTTPTPPPISPVCIPTQLQSPPTSSINLGSGSETPEQRRQRLMAQDALITTDQPPE